MRLIDLFSLGFLNFFLPKFKKLLEQRLFFTQFVCLFTRSHLVGSSEFAARVRYTVLKEYMHQSTIKHEWANYESHQSTIKHLAS